tara:strand:- start:1361 stop:1585 length:225 start_codon:yes stop_codon:yes gene_type:complete
MNEEQQQNELLAAVEELVSKYQIYGTPKMSGDGDITIPLDPDLKKKRARGNDMADVFSEMMKDDLRRVRPGWVE